MDHKVVTLIEKKTNIWSVFTQVVGLVVLMVVYMVSFLRCMIHLMKLPAVGEQHSVNSTLNCSIRAWMTEKICKH